MKKTIYLQKAKESIKSGFLCFVDSKSDEEIDYLKGHRVNKDTLCQFENGDYLPLPILLDACMPAWRNGPDLDIQILTIKYYAKNDKFLKSEIMKAIWKYEADHYINRNAQWFTEDPVMCSCGMPAVKTMFTTYDSEEFYCCRNCVTDKGFSQNIAALSINNKMPVEHFINEFIEMDEESFEYVKVEYSVTQKYIKDNFDKIKNQAEEKVKTMYKYREEYAKKCFSSGFKSIANVSHIYDCGCNYQCDCNPAALKYEKQNVNNPKSSYFYYSVILFKNGKTIQLKDFLAAYNPKIMKNNCKCVDNQMVEVLKAYVPQKPHRILDKIVSRYSDH